MQCCSVGVVIVVGGACGACGVHLRWGFTFKYILGVVMNVEGGRGSGI